MVAPMIMHQRRTDFCSRKM